MSNQTPKDSIQVPIRSEIVPEGFVSALWEKFFRSIYNRLYPLGSEITFQIVNNQASAVDLTTLIFDKRGVSQAVVDFLIHRITTGTGATELVESGIFIVSYNPTSDDWNINLLSINDPDNSGVDFTITATGQIQYTSSSITGDPSISAMHYRARTLGGKNALYSSLGVR